VGRGLTIRSPLSELIEDGLKFRETSYDHPHREHAEFSEQSKVVQIPVIKLGLVVPLNLDPNSVFEIVDLVSRNGYCIAIDADLDLERFRAPAAPGQEGINFLGDRGLSTARSEDRGSLQNKSFEAVKEVVEFEREIS
jgi:hypothetical protein